MNDRGFNLSRGARWSWFAGSALLVLCGWALLVFCGVSTGAGRYETECDSLLAVASRHTALSISSMVGRATLARNLAIVQMDWPTLSRKALHGDTCWAVNAATFRWQVAIILSDTTIQYLPGTDVGVPVDFRPGASAKFKRTTGGR